MSIAVEPPKLNIAVGQGVPAQLGATLLTQAAASLRRAELTRGVLDIHRCVRLNLFRVQSFAG